MGAIEAGQFLNNKNHPPTHILLLEGSRQLLHKVSISGGGRCNTMHDANKSIQDITAAYPRGEKELLGPYTSAFGPPQALEWFRSRGVKLKTEPDGRMFPVTDSSETIVECLKEGARKVGVDVRVGWKVVGVEVNEEGGEVGGGGGEGGIAAVLTVKVLESNKVLHTISCDALLLATGSSREGYALARALGHHVVDPVPSLFTLELADRKSKRPSPLQGLAGISVPCAEITLVGPAPVVGEGGGGEVEGGKGRQKKEEQQQWKDMLRQAGLRAGAAAKSKGRSSSSRSRSSSDGDSSGSFSSTPTTTGSLSQRGPVLITHTGLSGPAILRLSAFAARLLSLLSYRASFLLDWVPELSADDIHSRLIRAKAAHAKKSVATFCPLLATTEEGEMIAEPRLPRRLWARLVAEALREGGGGREGGMTWGGMTPTMVLALVGVLKGSVYVSRGKSTHKEEFTTAGGVATREVDFKTFGSKKVEGVYFAGEILDVDGITGGYNFMNCWCGGYVGGQSMARRVLELDRERARRVLELGEGGRERRREGQIER
ncbi:hypothetical protein VYU27_006143 [Nannochloropsis oceanica]